ncbi:2'-5' RNA ligase [Gammaproteobacteria bacterium 54_18_T64]|nr:2'-5' RNA ligase [Gammaproteobacteria bacterium 54_18_T64]
MTRKDGELRAFIGMPLEVATQQWLCDSLAPLKVQFNKASADAPKPAPQIRWVSPENWHITLAFLGQIPQDRASEIIKLLANALATRPSVKTEIEAVKRFPHANSPIIAVLLVNNDALLELHGRIQEFCKIAGLRQERRAFKAHITLARIKAPVGHGHEGQRQGSLSGDSPIADIDALQLDRQVTLNRVQLLNSHLSPEGSRYQILADFLLRKPEFKTLG